jgi:hypothetical protein
MAADCNNTEKVRMQHSRGLSAVGLTRESGGVSKPEERIDPCGKCMD